jgi:polyhydroxyalkanoate synthesis regulator phasin
MAKVSISEASRLTGKSRTTLYRLIGTGQLSTCTGEKNEKLVDTSELLRVFGAFSGCAGEQVPEQSTEHHVTGAEQQSEQVIQALKQEVEHLRAMVSAQSSHIDSLKQAMQLLEHKPDPAVDPAPRSTWWPFGKK